MLKSLKAHQHIILEDENAFILVLLLHLQGHILFKYLVESLINETECALTKFLLQVEPLRYFQSILKLRVYHLCIRGRNSVLNRLLRHWCMMV